MHAIGALPKADENGQVEGERGVYEAIQGAAWSVKLVEQGDMVYEVSHQKRKG